MSIIVTQNDFRNSLLENINSFFIKPLWYLYFTCQRVF